MYPSLQADRHPLNTVAERCSVTVVVAPEVFFIEKFLMDRLSLMNITLLFFFCIAETTCDTASHNAFSSHSPCISPC
jgi:hypothetical protein